MPRLRILVVEEEAIIAVDLMLLLQRLGAEAVGPASSIAMARALVQDNPIDGALLDIRLGARELVYPLADALLERGVAVAFVTSVGPRDIPIRFAAVSVLRKPLPDDGIKAWLEGLPAPPDRPQPRRRSKSRRS